MQDSKKNKERFVQETEESIPRINVLGSSATKLRKQLKLEADF